MVDSMQRDLEELGLNGSEARVLMALLSRESGGATELARASGVPRSRIYEALESLTEKGLAQRRASGGAASWTTPGHSQVFDRLEAVEEERLRSQRDRVERLRAVAAQSFPAVARSERAYWETYPRAADYWASYLEMLDAAQEELLVFNTAPFIQPGHPNQHVLDMLARGVAARALYVAADLEHPDAQPYLQENFAYQEAGCEIRVVGELPMTLVVADRMHVQFVLRDPDDPVPVGPTAVHVEHPGFGAAMAATFEYYWAQGQPFRIWPQKVPTTSTEKS
jgi:hypothetical protein